MKGTGKSTTLKDDIRDAVAAHGADSIAVTSFTNTAAENIATMEGVNLPDHAVGTLHSLAYRAVGHSLDVATDSKVVTDWNRRVPITWRLTPDSRRGSPDNTNSTGTGGSDGDELLATYDMTRSRFTPPDGMPHDVREFAVAWEKWKSEAGCVDFVDMIRIALERALAGERAPGTPRLLISDEAQDMTPLETALLLAWGAHAPDGVTFALDDDQAINDWRGGDSQPIQRLGFDLDGHPQDGVDLIDRPLVQSHRIPASLHNVAQTWIEGCTRRRDKSYRPRDVDGQVYSVSSPVESPRTAQAIGRDVAAGRTVMVIASCEYMLRTLTSNLRKLGIPFGNRYRPLEPAWNPLRAANGMTTAERLYRYLILDERTMGDRSRLWTGDDVRAWLELVAVKEAGLVRGAKAKAKLLPSGTVDIAQIEALFSHETSLIRAIEPDLNWLLEAARGLAGMVGTTDRPGRLDYPASVARTYGAAALMDEPLVTTGTIHSVKGAQANCVYLCPSLSGAGYSEWLRGGTCRDNVIRLMYVGLTRAIDTCVVLGTTERSVPRSSLCPKEMQLR